MDKKQKIIGLTGGIASGKSTVAQMFMKAGVRVIDTDEIARVVGLDRHIQAAIKDEFGPRSVVQVALNRPYLASVIFSNDEKRKKLNEIMHPMIKTVLQSRLASYDDALVIVDVPLMYEANFDAMMDEIIVVYASEDVQIKRLMARNQLSEEQARARIEAQMPLAEKVTRADFVLDNTGSEADLREAFEKLMIRLTAEKAEGSE